MKLIKSENFTVADMETLKYSGNDRFLEFCSNYQIEKMEIRSKYKTVACRYYRRKVGALAR